MSCPWGARDKSTRFCRTALELIRRPWMELSWHVGDAVTIDEVIFGEPGDLQILGARSLEGMNLGVDSRAKKLVTGGPILAA